MFSLSDFFDLADRLKSAQTEEDKHASVEALRHLVEADIIRIFNNPQYPKRRRSFGKIRELLGIFDDSSSARSDPALREILYLMGARVHRGKGDDALWHLPKIGDRENPPSRKLKWSLVYKILIVLATLALVFSVLPKFWSLGGRSISFPDCISKGEDTPERWAKCYSRHPD
ncbi:MAG: hypothetical protein ACRBB0_09090 [Pelagimonas sp.]|uniref:hypothetical protein n=1 Tax=Pelagimonas sp. TaxID=2073170 RepID=UPI003D6B93E9